MNIVIQLLVGLIFSILIPAGLGCVQILITELKRIIYAEKKHEQEVPRD